MITLAHCAGEFKGLRRWTPGPDLSYDRGWHERVLAVPAFRRWRHNRVSRSGPRGLQLAEARRVALLVCDGLQKPFRVWARFRGHAQSRSQPLDDLAGH